jgi:hemoglobin
MSDPAENDRRTNLVREISSETGIDEAMIERLVRTFYGRVQQDALIGPVFAAKIDDWEHHIENLCAFWSSVTLMTGRYHGRPMQKHFPLGIEARHFDRWLALFETTAREVCPPRAADYFIDRARRIADSFEMALATQRGEMYRPRHAVAGVNRE